MVYNVEYYYGIKSRNRSSDFLYKNIFCKVLMRGVNDTSFKMTVITCTVYGWKCSFFFKNTK